MKVFLTALGCRLNEAELQTWANDFLKFGISVTSNQSDASLIVINTCAVTGEAARKSRQTIRRFHRKNPTAKIIVTGCYASLEKSQAQELLGVDLVVSNQDKNLLAEKGNDLLDWNDMPFAASEPDATALFTRNKERAFIKVQDGCRYRCTYCIVTIARGDEVSRTVEDIIEEVLRLENDGVKEIVITGVHVGGYGSDLDSSLYELVLNILKRTSIPRIRFASVEPWDLPDNFFELFKNPRLMPHMHLPIQSGSNKILKKMSRRCKSESFLELVKKATNSIPDFNFTTDIIVGFPDESEDDFQLSLNIVKQSQFGHVHTFAYSKREGTKAAKLDNQVCSEVKKRRSQEMHKVAALVKLDKLEKMIGKKCDILWEGEGVERLNNENNKVIYRYFGYTPNYHKVFSDFKQRVNIKNQITRCSIVSVIENKLLKVKPVKSISGKELAIENQTAKDEVITFKLIS